MILTENTISGIWCGQYITDVQVWTFPSTNELKDLKF